MHIRYAWKAAAAALGGLAQVAASGLLPASWQPWGALVIAASTALGVYHAPNAVPPAVQ